MTAGTHLTIVEVIRGRHDNPLLSGPFPGARVGDVVAYDFELPSSL